jgi:AraC-like DNA-binding protein
VHLFCPTASAKPVAKTAKPFKLCARQCVHRGHNVTIGQFQILRSGTPGIEAVEAETRHVFPRHTHEQFGIGVIHRGAQKSFSGRGMVEAGPGDTITVNPGEVHDGVPIGETGRSWQMLYFEPAIIADARLDMSEDKSADFEFWNPVITRNALANRFRAAFAAMTANNTTDAPMHREEALLLLLADIPSEGGRSAMRPFTSASISRSKALVDDNPTAAVTLADLARESGMSRFQLLRGFAKATGLTPHAYLVQRRIHLARRLIAGGAPLAQAATDSGFADQSHMTRIFVRKYGITPGAFAAAVN